MKFGGGGFCPRDGRWDGEGRCREGGRCTPRHGGGIRQKIKRWRKEARQVEGFGQGKVMSWNWRMTTTYP